MGSAGAFKKILKVQVCIPSALDEEEEELEMAGSPCHVSNQGLHTPHHPPLMSGI